MGKVKPLSLFLKLHQKVAPDDISNNYLDQELVDDSKPEPPGMSQKSHIACQCDEREQSCGRCTIHL